MIKRYTFILSLLFYVAFSNTRVFGQGDIADSVQLRQTTINMVALFDKVMHEQSSLYSGPAFVPYNFRTNTNANFKDTEGFNNGSVNYNGTFYTNVPLIYNIERDMLESRLYNGFALYTLLSERVSEFNLLGHHFIRLLPDSLNSQLQGGFYDELYHGKLQLVAKHTKKIQQQTLSMGISNVFTESTNYFLKKGTRYYNVNSLGKFYDVLKDKKKELKQYLKDNKAKLGDNDELAMAALAAYYDHLTN